MKVRFKLLVSVLVMTLLVSLLPGFSASAAVCEDLSWIEGFDEEDFTRIAANGITSPMNNYDWSQCFFRGALYIGTGRNIFYQILEGFKASGVTLPFNIFPGTTSPRGEMFSLEWAEDMRGEIYRYQDGSFTLVYQSPVIDISAALGLPPGSAFSPREAGFRDMISYTDKNGVKALYAAAGQQIYDTGSLILKSPNGTAWQPVSTKAEMGSDSRALYAYNKKLYVALGTKAQIWATNDPKTSGDPDAIWKLVADFSASGNTGVEVMMNFNGYLYAGTQNLETGYQVWRSTNPYPSCENWVKVVEYGGGDMANLWAGTMFVFKNRLLVGSLSQPIPRAENEIPVPKGFELIRINCDDSWQLVIGDPIPVYAPPGATKTRKPVSGLTAGCGWPLNWYCWSMEKDSDGILYLGTFDATSTVIAIIKEGINIGSISPEKMQQTIDSLEVQIEMLNMRGMTGSVPQVREVQDAYKNALTAYQAGQPVDWLAVLEIANRHFGGGDMWKTEEGVNWVPVTVSGFGNPQNYGIREMTYAQGYFYAGTANPFTGFEIFKAVDYDSLY